MWGFKAFQDISGFHRNVARLQVARSLCLRGFRVPTWCFKVFHQSLVGFEGSMKAPESFEQVSKEIQGRLEAFQDFTVSFRELQELPAVEEEFPVFSGVFERFQGVSSGSMEFQKFLIFQKSLIDVPGAEGLFKPFQRILEEMGTVTFNKLHSHI